MVCIFDYSADYAIQNKLKKTLDLFQQNGKQQPFWVGSEFCLFLYLKHGRIWQQSDRIFKHNGKHSLSEIESAYHLTFITVDECHPCVDNGVYQRWRLSILTFIIVDVYHRWHLLSALTLIIIDVYENVVFIIFLKYTITDLYQYKL